MTAAASAVLIFDFVVVAGVNMIGYYTTVFDCIDVVVEELPRAVTVTLLHRSFDSGAFADLPTLRSYGHRNGLQLIAGDCAG